MLFFCYYFIYRIRFYTIYLATALNWATYRFICLFLWVNPSFANPTPRITPAVDLPTSIILSNTLVIKSIVFYFPTLSSASPLKKHFSITVENT
jgi:hypothetical protein